MQESILSNNSKKTPPPKMGQAPDPTPTLSPAEAYRLVHIALIEATLGDQTKMKQITEKLETIIKHQQCHANSHQNQSPL